MMQVVQILSSDKLEELLQVMMHMMPPQKLEELHERMMQGGGQAGMPRSGETRATSQPDLEFYISAAIGHNCEKPFLHLARKLTGEGGLIFAEAPGPRGVSAPAPREGETGNARAFFEANKVALCRIRQLADPATALVLPDGSKVRPRFSPDGVEGEREHVRRVSLPRMEEAGWALTLPVERLWAGERDLAALAEGCDSADRAVVALLLGAAEQGAERAAARAEVALLDGDADSSRTDSNGFTPLMAAPAARRAGAVHWRCCGCCCCCWCGERLSPSHR
jgi:hypothetical protein